jgi:AraC-like DNA-binding protein
LLPLGSYFLRNHGLNPIRHRERQQLDSFGVRGINSPMTASSTPFSWPTATIPVIRVAGRFVLNDRDYATRYLGRTHALHLHSYQGHVRIGERQFALREGDLTISPAGIASGYDLEAAGHHWCVHFYPVKGAYDAHVSLPLHLNLHGAATYVRERLMHISRLHASASAAEVPDALASARAAIALQELLLWCAARSQAQAIESGVEAAAVVERVAAIVDARCHEPLSIVAIAREVGKSQNYVARKFHERFGMTILQYALSRRVALARYLLESTDLPIRRIAERVGIDDAQYFNKQIRRQLGDSPSAIRAAARKAARRG